MEPARRRRRRPRDRRPAGRLARGDEDGTCGQVAQGRCPRRTARRGRSAGRTRRRPRPRRKSQQGGFPMTDNRAPDNGFGAHEERQALRKSVAAMAASYGPDYYLQKARAGQHTNELWNEAGKLGFLGVNLPEGEGGGGRGMLGVWAV